MADGLNEGEYRRGLVLGLTLAEVLLLLLFLVLVTLAAMYQAAEREHRTLASEFDRAKREFDIWRASVEGSTSDTGSSPSPLVLTALIQLMPEGQLANLVEAVKRAAELDPSDPPAVLIRGTELVKDERTSQALMLYTELTKLVTEEQVADVMEAVKRAAELDSTSAPAILMKGIDLVREARRQPGPQDISERPKLAVLSQRAESGHNWPPIITLSEANGYFFASGSAEVPAKLLAVLKGEVVSRLLALISEYNVDVIEVIGHTDQQPVIPRQSNLDHMLLPNIRGASREPPIAADNAGLGLARAAAVVRILRDDPRLGGVEILPLSGGQLIDVGDRLPTTATGADAPSRRRIEIRLRRRSSEVSDTGASTEWETQTTSDLNSGGTDALSGHPKVLDADTFDLGNTRIRLWGVDALEGAQTCDLNGRIWDCGQEASQRLRAFIADADVRCEPKDRDQYSRTVAKCWVRGIDLGGWLVSEGWALDYELYSKGAYRDDQASAKAAGRGIWRSKFIEPWEFRHLGQNEQ